MRYSIFKYYRNKKRVFVIAFFLIPLFFSCTQHKRGENKKTEKPPVIVSVEKASTGDIADTVNIYGEIKLRNETFLGSQFDGRLTGFSIIEGDFIKKGEKLGTIVPPMREALIQSIGELNPAQKKLIAEEVKEIPLYSPITGVVLNVNHHNGDVIKKGEPVLHIADLKTLDIFGDLPLKYLPYVKKNDLIEVKFLGLPHKNIFLPVSAIGGNVDKKAQTVKIRVALENENLIYKPGMRVVLSFAGSTHKNITLIPVSALLEEEGLFSVFAVKNNRAVRRIVKPGIRNGKMVEILNGIAPGDSVVTRKAYSLTEGTAVVVK
jgi:multidrug efflux pump subunit AcrA (membrane-fusion protein)